MLTGNGSFNPDVQPISYLHQFVCKNIHINNVIGADRRKIASLQMEVFCCHGFLQSLSPSSVALLEKPFSSFAF